MTDPTWNWVLPIEPRLVAQKQHTTMYSEGATSAQLRVLDYMDGGRKILPLLANGIAEERMDSIVGDARRGMGAHQWPGIKVVCV